MIQPELLWERLAALLLLWTQDIDLTLLCDIDFFFFKKKLGLLTGEWVRGYLKGTVTSLENLFGACRNIHSTNVSFCVLTGQCSTPAVAIPLFMIWDRIPHESSNFLSSPTGNLLFTSWGTRLPQTTQNTHTHPSWSNCFNLERTF